MKSMASDKRSKIRRNINHARHNSNLCLMQYALIEEKLRIIYVALKAIKEGEENFLTMA